MWTPQARLKIIKALAHKSQDRPVDESHQQLMERIMFLCDMPDEFLEATKGNYQDVIDLAEMDLTVEL